MDAIVFELRAGRYCMDLALVQAVVPLGPVTPVPGAPPALRGAMNVKGSVVPVVDLGVALEDDPCPLRPGEEALLIAPAAGQAVCCVRRVLDVIRVADSSGPAAGGEEMLHRATPERGPPLHLLDTGELLRRMADGVRQRAARLEMSPLGCGSAGAAGDSGAASSPPPGEEETP